MTALLYAGLSWLWFTQLVPEAGGLTPFDGRLLGYSVDDATTFLAVLSDRGRAIYLNDVRRLDTLFPLALALLLAWPLWRRPSGISRILVLLPMIYLCADLTENAAVAHLLEAGLPVDPTLTMQASRLTQVKYASLALSTIALLIVYVRTRKP